jgi:hypothetical protein
MSFSLKSRFPTGSKMRSRPALGIYRLIAASGLSEKASGIAEGMETRTRALLAGPRYRIDEYWGDPHEDQEELVSAIEDYKRPLPELLPPRPARQPRKERAKECSKLVKLAGK